MIYGLLSTGLNFAFLYWALEYIPAGLSMTILALTPLLTFLFAGHHTIAMSLTWTLYLLSRDPEWEARVLEEIRQVVPSDPVTSEHIAKLVTVQQVLKESMRLYPPVWALTRRAATERQRRCGEPPDRRARRPGRFQARVCSQ